MSDLFSYLLYCISPDQTFLLIALRLKPTPAQSRALQYWREPDSQVALAEILKEYPGLQVIKVEKIFEVIDIK